MKQRNLGFLLLGVVLSIHAPAHALSIFVELPGVNGESDPPGRPDVIALDSLSVASGGLVATKLVDATSAALFNAAVMGTSYASASLLFYDNLLADAQPDAALVLHTALVTGIQPVTLGSNPGERVSFAFAAPGLSLFLALPGVTGESTAPGHSGVIEVESIALSTNGFSVLKLVDATSSALYTASVSGTPYSIASLLFYEDILSASQPDFALVYQHALVTSIVAAPSLDVPRENVSFASASVQVVPAPDAVALLAAALAAAALARLRSTTTTARGQTALSPAGEPDRRLIRPLLRLSGTLQNGPFRSSGGNVAPIRPTLSSGWHSLRRRWRALQRSSRRSDAPRAARVRRRDSSRRNPS